MKDKSSILLTLLIGLTFMASPAYSADLGTMFASFQKSGGQLINFVNKLNVVIAIFLIIGSVFRFAQVGQDPRNSPRVPIAMFLCGVFLWAMTGTLDAISQSLAMGPSAGNVLLDYKGNQTGTSKEAIKGVLIFIQLLGYIAFIRGVLMLNQAGMGKDGMVGRGLTHCIGGVLAINILMTVQVVANTYGLKNPLG